MNIVILPHFLLSLLAVTLRIVMSGCGSSTAQPVAVSEISAPQSFSEEGTIWTLKPSMEVADEKALTQFFASQPDFQGSTNFEGPPVLFLSGTTDRRFFWLHGAGDAATWSCVHFEDGSFQLSEGSGNPFSK
ncbi:MAG: hypothetical protein WCO86_15750 [Planctomycetota bacterium]